MDERPQIPEFLRGHAVTVADHSTAKPIIRMVNKMLKARVRLPSKGLTTGDIKVKHKKLKYW